MVRIERGTVVVERPLPVAELVGHGDGGLVVMLTLLETAKCRSKVSVDLQPFRIGSSRALRRCGTRKMDPAATRSVAATIFGQYSINRAAFS